jgi:hypothetical protein
MKKLYLLTIGVFLIGLCNILTGCKKGETTSTTPIEVTPTATSTLSITDFSPKAAVNGSYITITGTGFGNDPSVVFVAFGTSNYYHPVSVTPTSIVIQTNLQLTSGQIKVSINGNVAVSTASFTRTFTSDLTVHGYAPENVKIYDQIKILGTGFGTDTNAVRISFNGSTPIKPKSVNNEDMIVIVPADAQTGKATVTVNGSSATGKDDVILEMSIIDFSPKSVTEGDTIKIAGVQFTSISDLSIDLNTTTSAVIKPIKVTPKEIQVVVPFSAKSGYIRISSLLSTETLISRQKFTFTPRVYFYSVPTPSSAKVNEVIKINGDFTGADISTITVSFGGSKPVQPISITGPDIFVKVPIDAKTGKITITRTGYTPFTGATTFTVIP